MRVRGGIVLLAMVLSLGCSAVAQGRPADQLRTMPEGELGMVKTLMVQERAWNNGDIAAFVAGYKNSPDTIFMGQTVTRGYETILEHYHQSYPDASAMGRLSFSHLEPHLLDENHGTLVGSYRLERSKKAGGDVEGLFSLVMEKTADGWKIILDHTT